MIDLLLVTAPGCRFCERARRVLDDLASDLPLRWQEVSLDSEEGRRLATRWRAPFPPLLVVRDPHDEALLGHGRLSRRRLARQLTAWSTMREQQEAGR